LRINEVFLGSIVRRLFSIVFLFLWSFSFAQEKKILPRVSIRASCTIPKAVSTSAFRHSFLGLYDANLSVNVRLFDNFGIGLGYNNALFNSAAYFRLQKGLSTRLQVHNGFLRIGVDRPAGEKSFYTLSLNSGYSYNQYTGVACLYDSLNNTRPKSFTGIYLKPEFTVNFQVEENFAFGIHLAYHYCLFAYDPALNCFDTYASYDKANRKMKIGDDNVNNRGNIGWISFGFGFYYGFKRKKA
jgi:hypothetical protein